jgi:hypothetical protein
MQDSEVYAPAYMCLWNLISCTENGKLIILNVAFVRAIVKKSIYTFS